MNQVFLTDSFGTFNVLYFDEIGKASEIVCVRNSNTFKHDTLSSVGVWNIKNKRIENLFLDSLISVEKINENWEIPNEIFI